MVVVNGRISDKSFPSYKKAKRLLRGTFSRVSLVLAQTQTYAERFIHLGCAPDKVLVTGSIKYDTAQITNSIAGADTLAQELQLNEARLWVAGGTGTDEEGIILAAFQGLKQQAAFGDVRLAIVPRKPERFDTVAQQIQQTGFSLLRYSQIKGGSREDSLDSHAVILGPEEGVAVTRFGVTHARRRYDVTADKPRELIFDKSADRRGGQGRRCFRRSSRYRWH